MYDYIKTAKGWIIYWGPAPVLQAADTALSLTSEIMDEEPWVLPYRPRAFRKPELAPVA